MPLTDGQKRVGMVAIFVVVLLVCIALFLGVQSLMEPDPSPTPGQPTITSSVVPAPPSTVAPGRKDVIEPPALTKPPPKLAAQDYVVKPGDTLWSISGHFANIPGWFPAIANASWVKNPNLIYPGQVLHIPEIS